MKKIYLYVLLSLFAVAFASCSDKEDCTPSHADVNKFEPRADDTSVEAGIRREFKEKTNSYLLFNDTLSKEKTGEDMYGHPVYKVETLDIGYEMVGDGNSYIYTYDLIQNDAEKKKAAELVETKLAKKLGGMMPFSVILANKLYVWTRDSYGNLKPAYSKTYGIVPNPTFVLGTRCWAFSLENGDAYSDDTYFDSMLESIIYTKLMAKGKSYTQDFCDVIENYDSYDYYRKSKLGYENVKDEDLARRIGFITDYSARYFSKDREWDTRLYIQYLLTNTYDEIEKEFAPYPNCLKRFSILRDKILALGFNFDA